MIRTTTNIEWHVLSASMDCDTLYDVTAAKDEDGVGIIARWTWRDGKWDVQVWHTEMDPERLEDDDGESVPADPIRLGIPCPCCKNGKREWNSDAGSVIKDCPACEGSGKFNFQNEEKGRDYER